MELLVLRHAIAIDRGTPEYLNDDSARPLTSKGMARMRQGAAGMARMGLAFDLILSSPYRRAWQTAEIVVETLRFQRRLEMFSPLQAEVEPAQALQELAARADGCQSVLIVGHEPQLSGLGSLLLCGDVSLDLQLKKGGLYKLRCARPVPASATLEWWLTPRQLRELARPSDSS